MNTPSPHATESPIGVRDALVIVDLQNDFLPGGALAVPAGHAVIPPLNTLIDRFQAHARPIVATRDWHPSDHCSFQAQGGPWPPHCIAEGAGAAFAADLRLPAEAHIVSKATAPAFEAYSGFEGTELADWLQANGIERLVIGGLATDYCVRHTVEDACRNGFEVVVVSEAIRAVEVNPGDAEAAVTSMRAHGAHFASLEAIT